MSVVDPADLVVLEGKADPEDPDSVPVQVALAVQAVVPADLPVAVVAALVVLLVLRANVVPNGPCPKSLDSPVTQRPELP